MLLTDNNTSSGSMLLLLAKTKTIQVHFDEPNWNTV